MLGFAPTSDSWLMRGFYALGSLALSFKRFPVHALLMIYYNQVLGMPALTVSAILTISLLLDAVFDPLIGLASDNFRSRFGRRLPFMYASILPMTLFYIALWLVPADWPPHAIAAYLTVCIVGLRFFDTLFEAPFVALIPEMVHDYDARTSLFTIKDLAEAFGGVIVAALVYNVLLRENVDGTGGILSSDGYPVLALATGLPLAVLLAVATVGLHRQISPTTEAPASPASRSWHHVIAVFRSRSFIVLAAAGILFAIGTGMGMVLSIYWLVYFYQFSQAQISILSVATALGLVLAVTTPAVGRWLGKRNAALMLCGVNIVASAVPLLTLSWDLVPQRSTELLVLVILQTATATASVSMIGIALASMVADLVEEAQLRTGRRSEGLLFSSYGFLRKASLALGTLGAGLILSVANVPIGADRGPLAFGLMAEMVWLYLVVKLALFSAGGGVLLLHRAGRVEHQSNLDELARNDGTGT